MAGHKVSANSPIGVFDSGTGGLTVVRQLRNLLPNESVLYFADTGRLPYGTKPQSQVREFSVQIGEFLRERGAKALIIACNTATAASLSALEETFPGPVIGVIGPGAQSAIAAAGTEGKVGLIATDGTVQSGVYDRELEDLGLKSALVKQGCPDFVTLVESGLEDREAVQGAVKRYMKPFHESPVDALILGCTHFPLLSEYIAEELPGVKLVDPAIQTVNNLKQMLEERGLLAEPDSQAEYKFFVSGDVEAFKRNLRMVLGRDDYPVEHVAWQ
ncbi:MAG: glutamate racemase [Bacillota bacterium]|jgi:glutamate racemase|nr:glutamate racemase [Bacillota bacterium]NLU06041.1 glutamate racemase [Candidatus Fermentithermobacillaceae bacterium]HOA71755.1 glutamate racemase [Bacillota bacterium]HOP70949.1 glutamate racemase [Bacillota bacterium]HPT36467.1 glutamate racemase [Bacillota bacterium]